MTQPVSYLVFARLTSIARMPRGHKGNAGGTTINRLLIWGVIHHTLFLSYSQDEV